MTFTTFFFYKFHYIYTIHAFSNLLIQLQFNHTYIVAIIVILFLL